jgi:hypothetical protein
MPNELKKKLQVYNLPKTIADGIERDVVLEQRSESEAALNAMGCYYTIPDDLRQEMKMEASRLKITEAEMTARIVAHYFSRYLNPDERIIHSREKDDKGDAIKSIVHLLEVLTSKLCLA